MSGIILSKSETNHIWLKILKGVYMLTKLLISMHVVGIEYTTYFLKFHQKEANGSHFFQDSRTSSESSVRDVWALHCVCMCFQPGLQLQILKFLCTPSMVPLSLGSLILTVSCYHLVFGLTFANISPTEREIFMPPLFGE